MVLSTTVNSGFRTQATTIANRSRDQFYSNRCPPELQLSAAFLVLLLGLGVPYGAGFVVWAIFIVDGGLAFEGRFTLDEGTSLANGLGWPFDG